MERAARPAKAMERAARPAKAMQRAARPGRALQWAALLTAATLLLAAGCAGEGDRQNWLEQDWAAIEEAARGGTVNIYMWGGDSRINAWMDGYAADELRQQYGVELKRVPMDASIFINKLINEKRAGTEQGVMDLVWINGENFKEARREELLYGSFAEKLPNFKYVDPEAVSRDFGFPTEGWESPFGRTQFVFEYDTAEVQDPPRSYEELLEWVRKNPGQFTYPQPPDFTGSAFIRQLLYAQTGGYQQYMGEYDEELISEREEGLWSYLRALKPHLWQEGDSYPQSKARLDTLFERGEVLINMDYNPTAAAGKILDGRYPESVRTFTMREGSLSNYHFLSIPFNAPNVPEALVTANFLLSPAAQYSKNLPENWGDLTALEMSRLPERWRDRFRSIELGEATLPLSELGEAAVPEISAEYVEYLEQRWKEEVLQ
jgi:putative spermidine/putrescine transport system substrate-binding protein